MFQQTFKNIDDVLWKEAGCATELDYTEQTSWILFLKYLDDLIKYVDEKLFPYLKGFRTRAAGANTIEYKIGEIFSEIENKFRSGYSLRDALELIDALSFRSQAERHELSALYEDKIRRMGNAGR